jgi:hypothetical protein
MGTRTITLDLPDDLYWRLSERAAVSQRGIEGEVIALLGGVLRHGADLSADLTRRLAELDGEMDDSLWQIARTRPPADLARELEALSDKAQRTRLSDDERARQRAILQEIETNMVVRAYATHLLKERGHDVSPLIHVA